MDEARLTSRDPESDPDDLREWIERLPVGAVWIDGTRLVANARIEALIGRPRERVATLDDWFREVYGDEAERLRATYEAARAAGFPHPVRTTMRMPDGAERILEYRAITDAVGEVWLVDDRTEDETAGTLVGELDDVLRKVSGHVPGTLYQFLARPDGTFAFPFATQGIRSLFGVEPEALRQDASPAFAVVEPDDLTRLLGSIERSSTTLDVWRDTFRVHHPARGVRWLRGEASPEALQDGGVVWHGYLSDVTELRQAQEALASSEAFLQNVFGATEAAMFVVDRESDGTFRYVGSSFEEVTGYRAVDVVGRPAALLTTGDSEAAQDRDTILPVIRAGRSWSGELERRRADDSR